MRKEMLNEDELMGVVGGKKSQSKAQVKARAKKKKEFDAAWKSLDMDGKGVSGMKRAEIFDEWEMAQFSDDAATFIAANA